MFGKKIVIGILAVSLVASPLHADNKTAYEILGGAGAGVAVLAAILGSAYYIIANNAPAGAKVPYSLADGEAMPYVSPTDPNFSAAASTYANNWVLENQNLPGNTPVPEGTSAADLQTLYPDAWAIGFENFVSQTVSKALGLKPEDVTKFVDNWTTSLGANGTYLDAINGINNAFSVGGTNSIGKWTEPEGYANQFDYLIKNELTSPEAVESLYNYMKAANSGYFPSKYTPGDMPPSNIPKVPGDIINPAEPISTGTGTGEGYSQSYVDSYNNVLNTYNSMIKTFGSLADYNNFLVGQYSLYKSQLATTQEEIAEAQTTGENVSQEVADQLQSRQAEVKATEDAYKAANDGEVIPVE